MKKRMDYIYSDGEQKILIESQQKDTRKSVIDQYISYRKKLGMTQAELARRSGVPRTNITRFEGGSYNPSLEMMVRIAAALEMKLQIELVEN
ncbi:MAG TPA: helix-turn-helix transcriptional regulator [Candidatus Mediterraneibacter faecipullorum]|uniref:Helix-turn-helix transcriptional regulator n=1 Tax=Candidatus Mediterraneibacter faecipullorum TaxID=2838670 RepID=A0A9D2NPX9_9FIRM|nr:helix-turn-helix transcriptional regulator [Candidatus Mediterraneibacter faecipullorum]